MRREKQIEREKKTETKTQTERWEIKRKRLRNTDRGTQKENKR